MAIIVLGSTRCALCKTAIEEGDNIVATRHFINDPHDFFYDFSDAAFHQRCFMAWEHRAAFVARYNATGRARRGLDGATTWMQNDGQIVWRSV